MRPAPKCCESMTYVLEFFRHRSVKPLTYQGQPAHFSGWIVV